MKNKSANNRAVFLDRDGVLNEILFHQELGIIETPFTVKQFTLKKQAASAVAKLNRLGLKAIVITNQPGIAMGNFTKKTLDAMHAKLRSELAQSAGAHLDDIFFCPHHPKKGTTSLTRKCSCRKPDWGMIRQAALKHNLDLKKSFVIGDSITDVQAGLKAGCKTILLAHLKCDLCHLMAKRGVKPHKLAKNLFDAVKWIKAELKKN